MIPQQHEDTGDREDPYIDPDSCFSDFIIFSEFAELTEFNENWTSFRESSIIMEQPLFPTCSDPNVTVARMSHPSYFFHQGPETRAETLKPCLHVYGFLARFTARFWSYTVVYGGV